MEQIKFKVLRLKFKVVYTRSEFTVALIGEL